MTTLYWWRSELRRPTVLGSVGKARPRAQAGHGKGTEWAPEREWRVTTEEPGYCVVRAKGSVETSTISVETVDQSRLDGVIAGLRTSAFFKGALQHAAIKAQIKYGEIEVSGRDRLEVTWATWQDLVGYINDAASVEGASTT